MIDWKPMDAAPKDKLIMATDGSSVASVYWFEEGGYWQSMDVFGSYDAMGWDDHPRLPNGVNPAQGFHPPKPATATIGVN